MVIGNWRLEIGGWWLEVGGWRLGCFVERLYRKVLKIA